MKKFILLMVVVLVKIAPAYSQSQQISRYFKTDSVRVAQNLAPKPHLSLGDRILRSDPETKEKADYVMRQLPFPFFKNDILLKNLSREIKLMIMQDMQEDMSPYQGLVVNF